MTAFVGTTAKGRYDALQQQSAEMEAQIEALSEG